MKDDIYYKLNEIAKEKNGGESDLASFLLNYRGDISKLKIKELTELNYVSVSTATRLAKRLELSGFNELKYSMILEQETRKNYQNKIINTTYEEHLESIYDSLKKTASIVDFDVVNTVAEKIFAADIINFYAIGSSMAHAMDFQVKLQRLEKFVNAHFDSHTQYLYALTSTKKTINLGISYSGNSKEVIRNLEISKKNGGGTTILITSNNNIKNDQIDYIIVIAQLEPIVKQFCISSRTSLYFILDMIFIKGVKTNESMYIKMLEKNKFTY